MTCGCVSKLGHSCDVWCISVLWCVVHFCLVTCAIFLSSGGLVTCGVFLCGDLWVYFCMVVSGWPDTEVGSGWHVINGGRICRVWSRCLSWGTSGGEFSCLVTLSRLNGGGGGGGGGRKLLSALLNRQTDNTDRHICKQRLKCTTRLQLMLNYKRQVQELTNPILSPSISSSSASLSLSLSTSPSLTLSLSFSLSDWEIVLENVFVYFFVFQAWLCDVEKTMRWTLKEVLKNCRLALKKSLTKRDKWIKEWPGQVSLFSSSFLSKVFSHNYVILPQSYNYQYNSICHQVTTKNTPPHPHTHTTPPPKKK